MQCRMHCIMHACRKVTMYNAMLVYKTICNISIKHVTIFYHINMNSRGFFMNCLVTFIDVLELLLIHATNFKRAVL